MTSDERKAAADKLGPKELTGVTIHNMLASYREKISDAMATHLPWSDPVPQKIFLTDVKSAEEFFCVLRTHDFVAYAVDENKMIIQKVDCLAQAHEFFEPNLPPKPILNPIHQGMPIYFKPHRYSDSYIWESELSDLLGIKFAPAKTSKFEPGFTITKKCVHDIKMYQGFTETYSYCEKCGAKGL